jgi:hypothetical protein
VLEAAASNIDDIFGEIHELLMYLT